VYLVGIIIRLRQLFAGPKFIPKPVNERFVEKKGGQGDRNRFVLD
jgi:hypothetical protein